MTNWRIIIIVSIVLFGFSVSNSKSTFYKIDYPKNWVKPQYDFSKHPLTKEKIELGRAFFYDPILSDNGKISCANCHLSFTAFTHVDHPLSHGINDSIGTRNSPVLINLAWNSYFMWDGAVNNIEMQPLAPISHSAEMGSSIKEVLNRLNNDTNYISLFKNIYGTDSITSAQLLIALAQFQLTLISSNSKYDQVIEGKQNFTLQESNGYQLFKKKCNNCHTEPLFTNGKFENNGIEPDSILNDSGRYVVTHQIGDVFKFKVPTLRNIQFSFPYMHDGRFGSLNEVLNHYKKIDTTENQNIQNLNLQITEREKIDLIAFLLTLSDKKFLFNPDFSFPRKKPNLAF